MDNGDYASAIERLKSSVDLDGSIFETQYNLAVAYTKAEDYPNAIKTYGDAIKLNPDFADAYYSLAVCEENLAKDIIAGRVKVNDDDSIEKADETEIDDNKKTVLNENSKKMLNNLLNNAISDYGLYQDKNTTSDDKRYVEEKVKELQVLLAQNVVK